MSFWMTIQRGLSIIESQPLDLRYQTEPGNEWNGASQFCKYIS